jgi:phasin protein
MNPRSDLSTEMIRDDSRVASEDVHENMRLAGDGTAKPGAEIIIRNAEAVQHALRSGAEIAVRMTEHSAANINAIVKSNVDRGEVTPTMSRDWMRFGREGIEHGFDRFKCLLQYRAPQHPVGFQEEVVRGSLDAFLGYAQRISDESVRMADELTRTKVTEWTDDGWVRRAA